MLFKNIESLIKKGVSIQFIVRASGENLEVTVLPNAGEGSKVTGLIPKTFTATAEELDSEFAQVMGTFAGVNASLHDQLASLQQQADDQAKEAAAATAATAAAKAKAKTSAVSTKSSKPVAPTLLGHALDPSNSEEGDDDEDDAPTGCATESCSGTEQSSTAPAQEAFTL